MLSTTGSCWDVTRCLAFFALMGFVSCLPLATQQSLNQTLDALETSINYIRGVSAMCEESITIYSVNKQGKQLEPLLLDVDWSANFEKYFPELPQALDNFTEVENIFFGVGDTIDIYTNLLRDVAGREERYLCSMHAGPGLCEFRNCSHATPIDPQYLLCLTEKSIHQLKTACLHLEDVNPDIPCLTHTEKIILEEVDTREYTLAILYKTISILNEADVALNRAKLDSYS